MRSLSLSLAITLALASSVAAETLRLPANGTSNVPTNAHLWIGDERTLDQATLRDAEGVAVTLERVPVSAPMRLRATSELAPQTSYTLTLRFAGVATEETLTFSTGAGAETNPPPPQSMVTHIRSWQGGGGGPWHCDKGTVYTGEIRTSAAPEAVYYRLERSLDGTTFSEVQASTSARFEVYSGVAWYRVRPVSISNLSPADSALQTIQFTVPESDIPPCYPLPRDDEAGCSTGSSPSGLLPLGLGLLLIRRRPPRLHGLLSRLARLTQRSRRGA